jgi:hypothetical protein
MPAEPERLVPKVHPLAREVAPEDPMELIANPVRGDPAVMLESVVQEYAWMGWDAEQLLGLFRSPFYPMLNQLWEHFGEEHVRRVVEAAAGRSGLFSVHETIDDDDPGPEDDHEAPELIQVSVARITAR